MSPEERIDILENRLIRFTQPFALNDPFEGQPDFYALGKKRTRNILCRNELNELLTGCGRITKERHEPVPG